MTDTNYLLHTVHDLVKDPSKIEVLRLLLDKDAKQVNKVDRSGLAPIHVAAYVGNMATLKLLLSRGAEKDARRPDGMTPMLIAAFRGTSKHGDICVELAAQGANVNVAGPMGMTVLHFLCSKGLSAPVLELLNAQPVGANVNARTNEKSTPLHAAVSGNHLDLALTLIGQGADALAKNKQGKTPLQLVKNQADRERLAAAAPQQTSATLGR